MLTEEHKIQPQEHEEQGHIEEEAEIEDRGRISPEPLLLLDTQRAQDVIDIRCDDLPTVDDALPLLHQPRGGREARQGISQDLLTVLLVIAHIILEVRGDTELLQLRAHKTALGRLIEDHIIDFLEAVELRDGCPLQHIIAP